MPPSTPADARVCILGAGPHGLALTLYLLAADPGLAEDVVVLDPSGRWLSTWETQLARMEIDVLRSPSVHHPCPDVDALSRFVASEDLMSTGLPYDLPTTTAFSSFTRHLVEQAGLAPPLPHRVRSVRTSDTRLAIDTADGTIRAERLVVAANPHRRVVPRWVTPLLHSSAIELEHSADVDLSALPRLDGTTVSVVGGGLTAAHLACGAARRGAQVHVVSRRPLEIRDFDTEPGWLGPKHLRAFEATTDGWRRIQQARAARGGGSIPPWMYERVERHIETGAVVVHPGTEVATATAEGARCHLDLSSGETIEADRVWLATGTTADLTAMRCLEPLLPDIAMIDDHPVTDDDLRVGPHPVHVMGRLATMTLGPASGNLWGARHAAHRITRAVTGVDLDFVGVTSSMAVRRVTAT